MFYAEPECWAGVEVPSRYLPAPSHRERSPKPPPRPDQLLPGYQITVHTSRGCAAGTGAKVIGRMIVATIAWREFWRGRCSKGSETGLSGGSPSPVPH